MANRLATPDIMGAVLSGATAPAKLRVDKIRSDGGTQMRAGLDDGIIAEYAEAMIGAGWGDFPPVVVFYDGATYWLADGFHRLAAYRAAVPASDTDIPADVRAGTQRDAKLHAAKANAAHGLRRTNADKRRAVTVLLEDVEWGKWSNAEIARRCQVSEMFVGNLRKELSLNGLEIAASRTVSRNGQTYQQDTTNIGKPAPRTVSPAPAGSGRTFKDRQYYSAVGAGEFAPVADGPRPLPDWVTGLHIAALAPDPDPDPASVPAPGMGWTLAIDADTDPAALGRALRRVVDGEWMGRLWDAYMGDGE